MSMHLRAEERRILLNVQEHERPGRHLTLFSDRQV